MSSQLIPQLPYSQRLLHMPPTNTTGAFLEARSEEAFEALQGKAVTVVPHFLKQMVTFVACDQPRPNSHD